MEKIQLLTLRFSQQHSSTVVSVDLGTFTLVVFWSQSYVDILFVGFNQSDRHASPLLPVLLIRLKSLLLSPTGLRIIFTREERVKNQ